MNFKIKIILFVYFLFSLNTIFAFEANFSNSYDNLSSCNNDIIKYNLQYPDFHRTNCFKKSDNLYYYNICSNKNDCWDVSNISIDNEVENQLLNIGNDILEENPYAKYFSWEILEKLKKIVNWLQNKKYNLSPVEYNNSLISLDEKLNLIKNKYPTKTTVLHLSDYLLYEINKMYVDTSVDNFSCELTDTCWEENTNSNSSSKNIEEINIENSILEVEKKYNNWEYILRDDTDYDWDWEMKWCKEEIGRDNTKCILYIYDENLYVSPSFIEWYDYSIKANSYCSNLVVWEKNDWILPSLDIFYNKNYLEKILSKWNPSNRYTTSTRDSSNYMKLYNTSIRVSWASPDWKYNIRCIAYVEKTYSPCNAKECLWEKFARYYILDDNHPSPFSYFSF
jgi:hypothetical protein